MRRNIVVSMLIIALAAALLGGATYAWFTGSADADANFTTGTIVLGEDIATDLTITDMAPGDTQDWIITIRNQGTLAMYYRFSFADASADDKNLDEVLTVTLDDTELIGTISNLITSPYFDQDTMSLLPGENKSYKVTFTLPTTADDQYQGAEFSGSLVVEATQVAHQDDGDIQWSNE